LKVTHAKKTNFFSTTETVAINPADGTPFSDSTGEPIRQTDEWVPAPSGQGFILKRDGVTTHPNPTQLQFKETSIQKQTDLYSGPELRPIYYRDFLCPLNAPTIQDADCVVHVMGYSANQLAQDYMANPGADVADLSRAIQALRNARGNTPEAKAGADTRSEKGETSAPITPDPQMEVGEFYIR
jgi:hypothetical protein